MSRINTNVSSLIAQKTLRPLERQIARIADAAEHRFADQRRQGRPGRFDRQRKPAPRHHQHQQGDHQQRAGQPAHRHGRQRPGPGQHPAERHPRPGGRSRQHGRARATSRSRPTSCRSTRRWKPSTASPRSRRSKAASCSTAASTSRSAYAAGGATVRDLNIEQANLGAAGSVDVDITITAAATQALLTNTRFRSFGRQRRRAAL